MRINFDSLPENYSLWLVHTQDGDLHYNVKYHSEVIGISTCRQSAWDLAYLHTLLLKKKLNKEE